MKDIEYANAQEKELFLFYLRLGKHKYGQNSKRSFSTILPFFPDVPVHQCQARYQVIDLVLLNQKDIIY